MIQVVKSRWMADCILFLILTQFTYSGSLIFWQFWVGDTILLVIMEKRAHFIGYLKEEVAFYLFCFIIWSMLYLEGWSSRL